MSLESLENRRSELCRMILSFFRDLCSTYLETYDLDNLSNNDFLQILNKLASGDEIGGLIMYSKEKTVREKLTPWYLRYVNDVNNKIDRLFLHYDRYISSEFSDIMERIRNSNLHNSHIGGVTFNIADGCWKYGEDLIFKEYYTLYKELKRTEVVC